MHLKSLEKKLLKIIFESKNPMTVLKIKKCKPFKHTSINKINMALNFLKKQSLVKSKNKEFYLCKENSYLKFGIVIKVFETFGIVKDENNNEILIPGKYMLNMLPGDKVLVKLFEDFAEGSPEGEVLAIKNAEKLIYHGKILNNNGVLSFVSYEINFDLKIKNLNDDFCNKLVSIKIVHRGRDVDEHVAVVEDVIGSASNPQDCCNLILKQQNVRRNFDSDVLNLAHKVASQNISQVDYEKREDLRNKVIFTIDGADSKDLDDAISIEKFGNGSWQLGVHIADVSHYVVQDSLLDVEAFKRGTSIYYADKVIPMLPKEISNGICSLNPNKDRLTFSVFMDFDANGNMLNYDFKKSVIRSRVKGVYSEINSLIDGIADNETKDKYKEVKEHILLMLELSDVFHKRRDERCSLNIKTQECKVKIDGEKVSILPYVRGKSEEIIEEFMLKANEAAAQFAQKNKLPFIYRVHEKPPSEKLTSLCNILNNLNLPVPKNDSQVELAKILKKVDGTKYEYVINNTVLRCMAKAKYSSEYNPHYGLVLNDYSHFTSPIRRYPDLFIHRIMSEYLKRKSERTNKYFSGRVSDVAFESSVCEKNADNIERECEDIYKAYYMTDFIGKEFSGIVASIASYGFYVMLPNFIEGLVHKNTLPDGEYEMVNMIEFKNLKDNEFSIKIGDTVTVRVLKTDVFSGYIDFELCSY